MNAPNVNSEPTPAWLKVVRDQVTNLRFGVVQITVHESRVVQIERTEKVRLDKLSSDGVQLLRQSPSSNQHP
jgi:hypothetical protein